MRATPTGISRNICATRDPSSRSACYSINRVLLPPRSRIRKPAEVQRRGVEWTEISHETLQIHGKRLLMGMMRGQFLVTHDHNMAVGSNVGEID